MLGSFQTTKKPASAGFFAAAAAHLLDRADRGGQAALVACGFVLVDQAANAEAVEQRLGTRERGFSAGFVTRLDGFDDFLDGGAHHRTVAVVLQPVLLRRARAFFRGLDICHYVAPESGVQKGRALSLEAGHTSIKCLQRLKISQNQSSLRRFAAQVNR